MDKLMLGLVKLFHAQFRHISLVVALDKARRQHLEGVKPEAVESTVADLYAEELRHRMELGPVYCSVVLQCSNFQNTVKDKLFFEAFQKFIVGKQFYLQSCFFLHHGIMMKSVAATSCTTVS